MSSMIKRYSRVFPPCFAISSPAAFAEPPGNRTCVHNVSLERISELTSSNQVVDNNHVLPRFDSFCLHFKGILQEARSEQHKSLLDVTPTVPYSFSYVAVTHCPGSFPCFLTGTNAAPSRSAMIGPSKNPLASNPTTTSIFFVSALGMVFEVKWCMKWVISVSNATGSRRIGNISKKTMPWNHSA